MAYSVSWDEGVPVGATTPAADIDTEIQKVKTSLRERLEQVMPDFDSDVLDPKKLTIDADVLASRPANPSYQGQMYFATDTGSFYVGNAALEWVTSTTIVEEGDDETPSASFSASMTLTASYQLPADTNWHVLSGWSVKGSRGTFYSGSTPTRLLIPASGDYKLSAVIYAGLADGIGLKCGYGVNGSAPFAAQFARILTEQSIGVGIPLEVIVYSLSAGNYLELHVQHEVGGSPTPWVYANGWTHISLHRLP